MEQENKMGVMPMGRLIFQMSFPMIIAMLVQACYNIVDSMYIARFSNDALAAVSYAFPAQNLMIAFATGIGVGVNALMSKSLGEKNFQRANRAAGNGGLLVCISYLLFLLFGLFGSRWLIAFQTSTPAVIDIGTEYISICCIFSFGIFGEIYFERLMQGTGKTHMTLLTQGCGALFNILLDPIFIFGWFGLPAMGAKGAAMATVIGQCTAFVIAFFLHHYKNHEIRLTAEAFRPERYVIQRVLAVGVPSILMVGIGSLMTTGMNIILNRFSDMAVSIFGIYSKLQSFVFMPVFGLNNGVVPVVAFNYGAKRRKRMIGAIRIACVTASCIMLAGLFFMQVFPDKALLLFDATEEMLAIGVPALRTISLSFLFAGTCIALSSVFQALGHGIYATIVSSARQLLILLPAAHLFSLSGQLHLVWFAFPLAEIMSIAASLTLYIRLYRKVIRQLPD